MFHREWANVSLNQNVKIKFLDLEDSIGPSVYISKMVLELKFWKKSATNDTPYNTDEISSCFLNSFPFKLFCITQPKIFDFQGKLLVAIPTTIETSSLKNITGLDHHQHHHKKPETHSSANQVGILIPQSSVFFIKSPNSMIKLTGSSSSTLSSNTTLLKSNFKFEDLGIGGLDEEFTTFFRRAFASRIFPQIIIEKLGIKHVKGILLFGPPGTGKTLIARKIGK